MAEVVASFDVLTPDVRKVGVDRPWLWLAAGWQDLVRSPGVSLAFGAVFAAAGCALSLGAWLAGTVYLVLPLAAGFMIVGPVLAVGLYEISRRHASGEPVSLGAALRAFGHNPRHLAVMGFVLLLVMLTWIRLAIMILML